MWQRRLGSRELTGSGTPSRTPAWREREASFAHQGARHGRGAVDELGATFRRVPKFLGRQLVDAPAASLLRLENRHSLPSARKLAPRHEARGASADDQEMSLMQTGHRSARFYPSDTMLQVFCRKPNRARRGSTSPQKYGNSLT